MSLHLLIIDALNLIRRLHAVQGSPCREACVAALHQLLGHTRPTHVVAVFDSHDRQPGWRHQLLPDYKAGRPPMPDDLQQEMASLQAAFEASGVSCWVAEQDEADDLAATLAVKMADAGHQATIVSTDKGYCQLLAPSIRIRDYFSEALAGRAVYRTGVRRRAGPAGGLLGLMRYQQQQNFRRARHRTEKRAGTAAAVWFA